MGRHFGIDVQSSGIALGCAETGYTEWSRAPKFASKMTWDKRYARLVFMHEFGSRFRSGDVVLVEKAYGASRTAQTVLMQMFGTFIAGVMVSGARVEEINTSTWKKTVLDNGSADKDKVRAFAEAKLGRILKTQDEADAYCISLACQKIYPLEVSDEEETLRLRVQNAIATPKRRKLR